MKFIGISLLVGTLFIVGVNCNGEDLKIGAGAAPTENILKPIKDPFAKATGINLIILSAGPKNALIELDRGGVDAATAGLTLADWLELMKKEGYEVKEPARFKPVAIGKDRIIVIINKENPVAKLSKEQLKGVFTGKIENWKDLGGLDMPILVVWGSLIQGTNSMWIKHMLDGEAITFNVLQASTAEDVRLNVSSSVEAIGIGPMAVVDESVKSPETPEVAREITLLTKGEPSPAVLKLIDFIRNEGRTFLKQ